MDQYKEMIRKGRLGEIVPMVKEIDMRCPVEFFAKVSDYGRKQDCCLFESREHLTEEDAGELTFGTADPALYLTGTGQEFTIKALSPTGVRILKYLAGDKSRFDFCKTVDFTDEAITGTLSPSEQSVD